MKFDVVVPVHCDLLDHSGQDHLLDVQRGFFVHCPEKAVPPGKGVRFPARKGKVD